MDTEDSGDSGLRRNDEYVTDTLSGAISISGLIPPRPPFDLLVMSGAVME